jgi:hypothetical protein
MQCAKLGSSGSGNYDQNDFERMYGPVHDCSTATNPYLRLWHSLDVEGGNGDAASIVLVRYYGLLDTEVVLAEFRSDVGAWTELNFDLAPYKNDQFRIKFLFDSDNDTNLGTGWLLDNYEVLDADPAITSISPERILRGSEAALTITGQRFGAVQGASSVLLQSSGGGTAAGTVTSWSDTSIEVTAPLDAASGDVVVRVLGHDSSGEYLAVVLPPPVIDDLEQKE